MLLYQIALTLIPRIGHRSARRLLQDFTPDEVFRATPTMLESAGFHQMAIQAITKSDVFPKAEKELSFIQKNEIKTLFYTDESFPYRLKFCDDTPVLLYYRGDFDFNATKIISIVGTRKSTDYGVQITRKIIEDLSIHLDIVVVSGLAYGIDTAAHHSSLEFNVPTVGVVAHGLDILYPSQNRKLAKDMLETGAIISEFPSGTIPDRENFPQRNRIIAGLADAVLVVEAAKKGGALITAELANSYGREVFAIPGRINDTYSEGCNKLINNNKAILTQSANDIMNAMNWRKKKKSETQLNLFADLNKEEQSVVDFLKRNANADIDSIIEKNNLNSTKAASILLNLELKGLIYTLPGKRYNIF
ncbi:MAG: DNA-processing protein DprA [Bacteroidales bacterium]